MCSVCLHNGSTGFAAPASGLSPAGGSVVVICQSLLISQGYVWKLFLGYLQCSYAQGDIAASLLSLEKWEKDLVPGLSKEELFTLTWRLVVLQMEHAAGSAGVQFLSCSSPFVCPPPVPCTPVTCLPGRHILLAQLLGFVCRFPCIPLSYFFFYLSKFYPFL